MTGFLSSLPSAEPSCRPRIVGKSLFVNGEKLFVRGVTYGTFQPGPLGTPFPDPLVVRNDFAAMASVGLNAVRVYSTPPRWLLDEAWDAGLRVLVGIPWEQHVAFLEDRRILRSVEARIRRGITMCAGHPAVLGYAVGNEIPAHIVRWSGRRAVEGHLRHLYDLAKELDPKGLVTYVNYPSTEYLDLHFLDFVAFNVFLESSRSLSDYIARLQNLANDRPLLITELGLDSRRNGLEAQARLLGEQVMTTRTGGCAGGFVFAWTDEWHRGGWEVTDWDFGLTRRDRTPKPALEAVGRAFTAPLEPPGGTWPRISVVVCVHNGERWIESCLEGIRRLRYPDYQVVVVDDGSTDGTPAILARMGATVVRTENRGLARARNAGIAAVDGQIVAFIDADAEPDESWLTHLALAFESSDFVGIGGPNIAPPDDEPSAWCVANAPGLPVHILRTDREADHIPGCNMAFRRDALEAIGGFDPIFRVAGDDVDVCWRLQDRGWSLGFAPGAVVLHHPRSSVRAFWLQQRGYGAAEALLEEKWPEKYNVAGHVTWGGRVYGPPALLVPGRRSRVYGGTWGEAAFQRLEARPPSLLWELAAMPEWYFFLCILVAVSGLGALWRPLLAALPVLLIAGGITVARAFRGALRSRFPEPPSSRTDRVARIGLVALLHLLQPAARLTGRFVTGLVPWRGRVEAPFSWPRRRMIEIWRERGEPLARTLRRVEESLRSAGSGIRCGGGYDDWDLQVLGGSLGFARLRSCAEEHGYGKQLLRAKIEPLLSPLGWFGIVGGSGLVVWSALVGRPLATLVLGVMTLALVFRAVWECGSSVVAFVQALQEVGIPDVTEEVTLVLPRPSRNGSTPGNGVLRRALSRRH